MNKPTTFNPFTDRLSRDIRNSMSETIIDVLDERSLEKARAVAHGYLQTIPAPVYADYIHERLDRYARALEQISPDTSLLRQAAILWNLGLLFEVHEILEPAWMRASGDRRLLLQALIRSVGIYINLEVGYRDRAAKIAAKALPVLTKQKAAIAEEIDIDALISHIEKLSATPPEIVLK